MKKRFVVCRVVLALLWVTGCAQREDAEPLTVTLWHVYGGEVDSPLNDLIKRFNSTVGAEQNIRVKVELVSNSGSIHKSVLAAANGDPGAPSLPDMFVSYPKTVLALPDEEILVECTETRDQPKNKERALARLRTFIYDKEHQKYVDDIANRRKSLVSTGDRSAKIRTYNFPQGRVTDHRIGYTTHDLQGFLNGNIQDMIDALTVAENAERLKESEL